MNPHQPKHTLLHSYCVYPGVIFETQSPGEEVVLLLRAHPFTQLSWIITTIVLSFILPLVILLINSFFKPTQIIFIIIFWYAVVFAYAFINFLIWLFNVGIVTNKRVVDIDFSNVLYKEISASVISKIEDVTVKTGGFIPSLFDYGNLYVQTAGTEENIKFINISHPNEAASIINNFMENPS